MARTDVRACVLGCSNADGIPFRASPGRRACDRCAEYLADVVDNIRQVYAALTEVDELIPGGNGAGSGARTVPGPRSPAVDAILVHTDPRSVTAVHASPAALAAVAGWARTVREDLSLDTPPDRMLGTVPAGRITMERELGTLRFNWDWVLDQPWLEGFAAEMGAVLEALRIVGRMTPRVLQVGTCPMLILAVHTDGDPIYLDCGARLRVRVGDVEIRCRNCGAVWPRSTWHQLGDPWTDYAALSGDLSVPVGTLRRWCVEDGWETKRTGGRYLVVRAAALASAQRRGRWTPAA
jgi:hypothetical protein